MPLVPPCIRNRSPEWTRRGSKRFCPHRKCSLGQRCCGRKFHFLGNGQTATFMRNAIFGVSTPRDQRAHFVVNLPAFVRARPTLHNLSRDFQSQDVRSSGRWRVMSLALVEICPIHSRSGHANQHLAWAGSRHLTFFNPQHSCSAKSYQPDRSHPSSIAARNPSMGTRHQLRVEHATGLR